MEESRMSQDIDRLPPSSLERGDLLITMKRFALAGYLATGAGSEEEFDVLWREALCADQPVEPVPHLGSFQAKV
jgi:hypothetical protein